MRWRDSMLEYLPAHARESGVVFAGDVLSKFLTFLITILLLKLVTPAEYALYGVFIAVLPTVNQFTDSGLSSSIVRFQALYQHHDPDRATAHLRVAWMVKWAALLPTAALLFVCAPMLAELVFPLPGAAHAIRLVSLGVVGNGLYEFMQAVFQSRQRFGTLTAMRLSEGGGKLLFIVAFIGIGAFSLDAVYLAYVIVPTAVSAMGIVLARSMWGRVQVAWRDIAKEMFGFGKWMMLSSFATMFLMRLDLFMIPRMLRDQPDDIGLYAAAARLCIPLIVVTGSVATVFFPKAMALRTMDGMRQYIRKSMQITVPLLVLSVLYAAAVTIGITLFLPKYLGARPLFLVLFIGYAWTIFGNPLTMLVLSINRAHVVTTISIVQLFCTVASHYYFISAMGAMGAAVSTVLMWFLAGAVSLWYLYTHRHAIESATERGQT